MTQAPAAIFKIPTKSPQQARGETSSARRTPARQPKAIGRVAGSETRASTRGDGDALELELGITVYPPREEGGRWRAVWNEGGQRKQCESVSEGKLAEKLEKVTQRLAMGAANMTRPGAELIAWYLNPDRLPVAKRWSRRHADAQRRLCERTCCWSGGGPQSALNMRRISFAELGRLAVPSASWARVTAR